jgi:hypothetical protein
LQDQQEVLLDTILAGSKKKNLKKENSKNLETRVEFKTKTETAVGNSNDSSSNNNNNSSSSNSECLKADADTVTCNNGGDATTADNVPETETPAGPDVPAGTADIKDDPEPVRPRMIPNPTYAESNNSSEAADKITPIADGPLSGFPGANVYLTYLLTDSFVIKLFFNLLKDLL